jgi:hypothetical protein
MIGQMPQELVHLEGRLAPSPVLSVVREVARTLPIRRPRSEPRLSSSRPSSAWLRDWPPSASRLPPNPVRRLLRESNVRKLSGWRAPMGRGENLEPRGKRDVIEGPQTMKSGIDQRLRIRISKIQTRLQVACKESQRWGSTEYNSVCLVQFVFVPIFRHSQLGQVFYFLCQGCSQAFQPFFFLQGPRVGLLRGARLARQRRHSSIRRCSGKDHVERGMNKAQVRRSFRREEENDGPRWYLSFPCTV